MITLNPPMPALARRHGARSPCSSSIAPMLRGSRRVMLLCAAIAAALLSAAVPAGAAQPKAAADAAATAPAPVPSPATAPAPAVVNTGTPAAPAVAPTVVPAVAAAAAEASAKAAPLAPCPTSMGAQTRVQLAPVTPALAALLRERVQQRVGGVVTSVCRTPIGLFEVVDDAEIFYVDERADYLVAGKLIDLHTRENLTAQREDDAARIDFHTLPLDLAVKTVRGKGTRVFAVFEDPNCPYCKRFEKEIATLGDTTIYTFLYPILSRDAAAADDSYPKSRAIWCAPDRAAAWSQLMLEGKRLPAASQQCKHPLDEVLALGQKLHVSGTPTLIFSDGRRAPGAIPLDKVEQMLTQAEHAGAGASGSAAQ